MRHLVVRHAGPQQLHDIGDRRVTRIVPGAIAADNQVPGFSHPVLPLLIAGRLPGFFARAIFARTVTPPADGLRHV